MEVMEDHQAQAQTTQSQTQVQSSTTPSSSPRTHCTLERNEPVRSRWTPKPEQILILESIFNSGMVNPPKEETVKIRKLLEKFGSVGDANVFYWFQNRRSRSRRRQRQIQASLINSGSLDQHQQQQQQQSPMLTRCGGGGVIDQYQAVYTATTTSPEFIMQQPPSGFFPMLQSLSHVAGSSSSSSPPPSSRIDGGVDIYSFSGQSSTFPEFEHTTSMPSSSLLHLDTSKVHYEFASGVITVFINGVPTEVESGPLNIKSMFNEEVILVHSSGVPVPLDEYGISVPGLQHGESYFLVLKYNQMGKNVRQESSNIQLQNGNSGCMNKLLHALNRRHRWQNVRKVLPNKRQGSGKQIIDGGTSETTTNTSQPPDGYYDPKRNKPKMEQALHTTNTEGSSKSSKSSKKFRIRSLISDEMAKRRGKHHRRIRSPSPSRSPRRQTSTTKQLLKNEIGGAENEKPPTKVIESDCESPSITKKKRKCDICAAMLTVSYLRQNGYSNENQIKESLERNAQPAASDGHDTHYLHSHKRLTKSFSIPRRLGSSKRRDCEVEELKNKLKSCKDIQTAKEKFILPMNQLRDIGMPKPMLTRPESFKTPSTTSKKDKKQITINSKTLKQKIGFTVKDSKKEKRRILMDAVFHKIPYGRRSSKDPKKISLNKLKSNSTSSSGSDRSLVEKSHLKKTSSTSEAMSKYRRLLSQTSTRDQEKIQLGDHKTKLFVAGGEQCFGSSGKTHKRIRSLPNISPSDFKESQEFPIKPTTDIPLSISGALFDDQKSLDHFVYGERLNVYTGAKRGMGKENLGTSNLQEKSDRKEFNDATEITTEDIKLADKDKSNNENIGANQQPADHDEIIHDHKASAVDNGSTSKETTLVDKDEALDHNLGVSTYTSKNDQQDEPRVTIEVEKDKNFNDILGMFKKASDERTKLNQETDSIVAARKVTKISTVEKDKGIEKNLEVGQKTLDNQENNKADLHTHFEDNKDEGVNRILEDGNITLDHQENDNSPFGSCDGVEIHTHEDFHVQTSFVKDIRNSPMKDFSDENKQHGFSTSTRPSIAYKRHNNTKIDARNGYMMEDGFLHLDIDKFRDNPEFQFVKEMLERSGFLENQFLGEWYSNYQPIDPVLFEEVETTFLQSKILEDLDSMNGEVTQKIINDHHLLLFDIINEALLHLQNKTFTYCPHPLTYRSKVRPMPVGRRLLEEVWNIVTMYLSWKPEQLQPSLDDVLSRDLEKGDGWMNLQTDAEFVGIELEEMLADDLLDELVFDDLLM